MRSQVVLLGALVFASALGWAVRNVDATTQAMVRSFKRILTDPILLGSK